MPTLGPSQAHVEPCWSHLGPILGQDGPMLSHLGPILGPCWAHVGPMFGGYVKPYVGDMLGLLKVALKGCNGTMGAASWYMGAIYKKHGCN